MERIARSVYSEPNIGCRVGRSGAVSQSCRKTMERRGARSERSWSGNRAGSEGSNRLERGAVFPPQYSVFCLRCRTCIFDVWHVWVHRVRLVFVAVHYPRATACNKQVG